MWCFWKIQFCASCKGNLGDISSFLIVIFCVLADDIEVRVVDELVSGEVIDYSSWSG
jgi:hypothetical protein